MKKYKLLPVLQIVGNDGNLITFWDKVKKFDMDCTGQMDFELVVNKEDYEKHKDILTFGNFVALKPEDDYGTSFGDQLEVSPADNAGMIEKIKFSNVTNEVTLKGPTLRGILSHRIISPLANRDFVTVENDKKFYDAMQEVLVAAERRSKCTKNDAMLITTSPYGDGIRTTSEYTFDRYCTYLDGITKFLGEYNLKLGTWLKLKPFNSQSSQQSFEFLIWPSYGTDYTEEMIANYIPGINYELEIGQSNGSGGDGVNLITGLGQGELAARTIVKYTTINNLYNKPFIWNERYDPLYVAPLNLHEEAYDYSNAESYTFLSRATRDKLQGYINQNHSYTITINSDICEYQFEVNDKIAVYDNTFDVQMNAVVTNKIYRIENNKVNVEYSLEYTE